MCRVGERVSTPRAACTGAVLSTRTAALRTRSRASSGPTPSGPTGLNISLALNRTLLNLPHPVLQRAGEPAFPRRVQGVPAVLHQRLVLGPGQPEHGVWDPVLPRPPRLASRSRSATNTCAYLYFVWPAEDLLTVPALANLTQFTLIGASAGAFGVAFNCDWAAGLLRHTTNINLIGTQ